MIKQTKQIAIVAGDAGGANALLPVIKILMQNSEILLDIYAYYQATRIWKERGISYTDISGYDFEQIQDIYAKTKFDLLLCATSINDQNYERLFIKIAKTEEIPSCSLLDFWSNYSKRYSDNRIPPNCITDKIAIMDHKCYSEMIAEGFPQERLIITGQPAFDNLITYGNNISEGDINKIRSQFSDLNNEFLVCFLSSPLYQIYSQKNLGFEYSGFTERDVIPKLIETLEEIADKRKIKITLALCPHPRESLEFLNSLKSDRIKIALAEKYTSKEVISASDLIVGMNTVLLIEACYMGYLAISIQPDLIIDDPLPTNKMGYTIPIYNYDEIEPIIEIYLLDENKRSDHERFLSENLLQNHATENVTKIIYEMLYQEDV